MDEIAQVLKSIDEIKKTKIGILQTLRGLNKALLEYEMRYYLLIKKNGITVDKFDRLERKLERKLTTKHLT